MGKQNKNTGAFTLGYEPTENRIVVLPDEPEEISTGGIILPPKTGEEKEKTTRGVVIKVGKGYREEPMFITENMRVSYSKFAGTELEFRGMKFLIMRQTDVMGIIDETLEKEPLPV